MLFGVTNEAKKRCLLLCVAMRIISEFTATAYVDSAELHELTKMWVTQRCQVGKVKMLEVYIACYNFL